MRGIYWVTESQLMEIKKITARCRICNHGLVQTIQEVEKKQFVGNADSSEKVIIQRKGI